MYEAFLERYGNYIPAAVVFNLIAVHDGDCQDFTKTFGDHPRYSTAKVFDWLGY